MDSNKIFMDYMTNEGFTAETIDALDPETRMEHEAKALEWFTTKNQNEGNVGNDESEKSDDLTEDDENDDESDSGSDGGSDIDDSTEDLENLFDEEEFMEFDPANYSNFNQPGLVNFRKGYNRAARRAMKLSSKNLLQDNKMTDHSKGSAYTKNNRKIVDNPSDRRIEPVEIVKIGSQYIYVGDLKRSNSYSMSVEEKQKTVIKYSAVVNFVNSDLLEIDSKRFDITDDRGDLNFRDSLSYLDQGLKVRDYTDKSYNMTGCFLSECLGPLEKAKLNLASHSILRLANFIEIQMDNYLKQVNIGSYKNNSMVIRSKDIIRRVVETSMPDFTKEQWAEIINMVYQEMDVAPLTNLTLEIGLPVTQIESGESFNLYDEIDSLGQRGRNFISKFRRRIPITMDILQANSQIITQTNSAITCLLLSIVNSTYELEKIENYVGFPKIGNEDTRIANINDAEYKDFIDNDLIPKVKYCIEAYKSQKNVANIDKLSKLMLEEN